MLFFFLWGISAYNSDFSEVRVLEMKAQERCFISEFKASKTVKEYCLKDKYSAVITTTTDSNINSHKFGKDIVSELAFCQASEGDILCLKRNNLVEGIGLDIGIVFTG
jgi:hypothetical protein